MTNLFSLRQLIETELVKALAYLGEFSVAVVPIYLLKRFDVVVYRCAIAFSLKNLTIAEQLLQILSDSKLSSDFRMAVVESGWLDFSLSDRAIAMWLDKLPAITSILPIASESKPSPEIVLPLFPLQYAHARCCSLLRLAHHDGLIKLDDYFTQAVSPWQPPAHIYYQADKFQLVHYRERYLIHQLLAVVDNLSNPSFANSIKSATELSQAFLDFERDCRIWGEVKKETPLLAMARLGLTSLTQLLLKYLLQEQIKVVAPHNL